MAEPHLTPTEANLSAQSTKAEHGAVPDAGAHAVASTAADGGHGEAPHVDPAALGLNATAWVALAMLVVIGLMLWKKVPAAIAAGLDRKISGIRENLDEAARLRAEAEALRAEYEGRASGAKAEAEAMLDRARHEAAAIVAKAQADSASLIERRSRMAEDKIAAAERSAIEGIRAQAVNAATAAAARLIAEQHDAAADRLAIDRAISDLGRAH